MKVISQYGTNTDSMHLFDSTNNLKEKLTSAARDGSNIPILKDLIQGKFSQELAEQEKELINSAIYTAALNSHQDSLIALLNEGKTDISGLSNYFLFNEIETLKQDLLGTSHIENSL